MNDLHPDVPSLLAAHRVSGAEAPIVGVGLSGARLSRVESDGRSYILKRLRLQDDWLMRVTGDAAYREAQFAVSPLAKRLPAGVRTPSLGASFDDDGRAILMHDITDILLPDAQVVPADAMDAMLGRFADLHAAFWDDPMADANVAWCAARHRISLLGPGTGEMLIREGRDFGITRGWRAFEQLVPPVVADLERRLARDMTPLLATLQSLPQTLLHGDLKIANFGWDGDVLSLLDWAMVMRGPVAIDLAMFLTMNSSVLPWPLDETLDRYASHLEHALGAERFAAARWWQQRAAIMLSGIVYYGWGKALDAESGRPDELRWWCDGAMAAVEALDL
jgi:hypothetical protein